MAGRVSTAPPKGSVAQGSLSSPSADGRLFHLAGSLTARASGIQIIMFAARPVRIRIPLLAARQEPASLEEPSAMKIGGPTTAGPAPVYFPFSPAGERGPRFSNPGMAGAAGHSPLVTCHCSSGVKGNADPASGCTNLFEEELQGF
jgi:hypothetical protein